MTPAPAPQGSARRHLSFEAVDSTNTRALEAARAGDPGPLWVSATEQLAGRGRRGRVWASPPGNLYASLLLVDPAQPAQIGNLPLVVAVGVREALAGLPGVAPGSVSLKWPNDVMLAGGKCVGILIESEMLPGDRRAVVVGCGVNLAVAPSDAPYRVTSLREAGVEVPAEAVFLALANGVERALRDWRGGAGFSAIRERWLAHASGVGEACRVNLPDRSVEGRFVELDERGLLVIERTDGARQTISAGDVFFGTTTHAA